MTLEMITITGRPKFLYTWVDPIATALTAQIEAGNLSGVIPIVTGNGTEQAEWFAGKDRAAAAGPTVTTVLPARVHVNGRTIAAFEGWAEAAAFVGLYVPSAPADVTADLVSITFELTAI